MQQGPFLQVLHELRIDFVHGPGRVEPVGLIRTTQPLPLPGAGTRFELNQWGALIAPWLHSGALAAAQGQGGGDGVDGSPWVLGLHTEAAQERDALVLVTTMSLGLDRDAPAGPLAELGHELDQSERRCAMLRSLLTACTVETAAAAESDVAMAAEASLRALEPAGVLEGGVASRWHELAAVLGADGHLLAELAHDEVAGAVRAALKAMTRAQRIALWVAEGDVDGLEMWLSDGDEAADTFDPLASYPDDLDPLIRRVTRGLVARMTH